MICDCLVVGAGGRGGIGAYSGGCGAGEVIYYPFFNISPGIYNIQVGIDSATVTDRDSRLYVGITDNLKVTGGGNGGNGPTLTLSPLLPKAWTSSTSEVANRTIMVRLCSGRDITIDTTNIYYGNGTYQLY